MTQIVMNMTTGEVVCTVEGEAEVSPRGECEVMTMEEAKALAERVEATEGLSVRLRRDHE